MNTILRPDTEQETDDFKFRFQWNIDQHKIKPQVRMKNAKRPSKKINLWNPTQWFPRWRSKKPVITSCDDVALQHRR